jgi:hypothetical protein
MSSFTKGGLFFGAYDCFCKKGCKCFGCKGNRRKVPRVFCASGALMGGLCVGGQSDQPFNSCCCPRVYMDILDAGCYDIASNSFPRAIAGSFDSIAIKDGFVACLYAATNYVGDPFVVVKGPTIINNVNWRSVYPQSQFENYRMAWSSVDMYTSSAWQTPGSISICEYDGRTNVPEKGFSLA